MSSRRPRAYFAASAALVAGFAFFAGCQTDDPPENSDLLATPGTGGDGAGEPSSSDGGSSSASGTTASSGGGGAGDGGAGGGAEGGAGGSPPPPPPTDGADSCASVASWGVDHGFSAAFDGNTLAASSESLYSSPCEIVSGPEEVYRLDVAQEGTISIVAAALEGQDLTFHLRTECDDVTSATLCRNHDPEKQTEAFTTSLAAGTYFLFIDSEVHNNGSTGQGAYQVSVTFDEGRCGDGAHNAGEQCDDGNVEVGDGCDASCQLEPGSNDSCADPQGPILLGEGSQVYTASTLGNNASHGFDEVACGVIDYGGARERVIAVTPQITGELSLKLGYDLAGTTAICAQDISASGCWDRVLHVRHAAGDASEAACANVANQIACDKGNDWPEYVQELTLEVTANETYYVFIDSYWDGGGNPAWASGPYNLHMNLTAAEVSGPGGGGGGAGGAGGAGGGTP